MISLAKVTIKACNKYVKSVFDWVFFRSPILELNMPPITEGATFLICLKDLLVKFECFFGDFLYHYFPEEVLKNYLFPVTYFQYNYTIQLAILKYLELNHFCLFSSHMLMKALVMCTEVFWIKADFLHKVTW